MLRRTVVIPTLGWIGQHTTEGTKLDTWRVHRLKNSISRLSDRQLDRLIQTRPPPADSGVIQAGTALGASGFFTFLVLAGIRTWFWPDGLPWLILVWIVIASVVAFMASPPPDCGHADCTQRRNAWHRHVDRTATGSNGSGQ